MNASLASSTKLSRVLLVSVLPVLFAACSSVSLDESKAKIEERGSGVVPQQNTATTNSTDQRTVTTVKTEDPLTDPNNPLSKRSIYFDYDSYIVKEEYRATVEAHARYLLANTGKKISIEGNADERGSREYNLALGQKRAEAVRKALSLLGVAESQMEAVSFGEEKPRATGADEAAYAENRRADIAYK